MKFHMCLVNHVLILLTCFLSQCLVEAVCILDCVCVEDASLVFRTFPCIKALFGRLSSDLSFARVLLPIAQFYLNHGVCVFTSTCTYLILTYAFV